MTKPKINDGGPAFPVEGFPGDAHFPTVVPKPGMTLRDYFAGQALAGLIACANVNKPTRNDYAEAAYNYADAMLAARDGGAA